MLPLRGKKARFCSLYALHTRSITAAIKPVWTFICSAWERNTTTVCAVCVFLPGRWAPWCRPVSPLSPAQCPPSVRARQPCDGTEWARRDWSGLTLPSAFSKISREWGHTSRPLPRFCQHTLPFHTPTEGVSTQWAGVSHCGEQHRGI